MKTYYYYETAEGYYKTSKLPKDTTTIIRYLNKEEYEEIINQLREEMERLAELEAQSQESSLNEEG
ncbi:MAG: hypothetical protein MJZ03_04080 [archaeon]|nr:hypothetical protein [archaeon]